MFLYKTDIRMNHNHRFIVLKVNGFRCFRKREVFLPAVPVETFTGLAEFIFTSNSEPDGDSHYEVYL
jgi:hypothetical protein